MIVCSSIIASCHDVTTLTWLSCDPFLSAWAARQAKQRTPDRALSVRIVNNHHTSCYCTSPTLMSTKCLKSSVCPRRYEYRLTASWICVARTGISRATGKHVAVVTYLGLVHLLTLYVKLPFFIFPPLLLLQPGLTGLHPGEFGGRRRKARDILIDGTRGTRELEELSRV